MRVSANQKDTAFCCPMDALARPARGLPLEATKGCVSIGTCRHAPGAPDLDIDIEVGLIGSKTSAEFVDSDSLEIGCAKEFNGW